MTWDEAEKLSLRAIHDTDGRGMVGGARNHLHQRVARAILDSLRAANTDAVQALTITNDDLTKAPTMNASDFSAWVAHMKETRRWSAARCSRELGCGINQIKVWSETGAPFYIGLACAALSFGLPPWKAI